MSDLISRSALKMAFEEDGHLSAYIEEYIDDVPAVDAAPVVRCRDCKHRGTDYCPMLQEIEDYDEDAGWDYWYVDNTDDDGYCHMGAKMDGGAKDGEG